MADKRYRIRANRWNTAYMEGFSLSEDGTVTAVHEEEDGTVHHSHTVFLAPVDSAARDSEWGRLTYVSEHAQDTAVYIYALARNEKYLYEGEAEGDLYEFLSDPEVSRETKLRLFRELGAIRSINHKDMLLYELSGRYLYLAVDVIGDGEVSVSDMVIYAAGDNFMQTFPEIYRERNGFFHRFMSVFSSVYNDFQLEIDELPKLLDVDNCPPELLTLYASWLGIDLSGGFLSEQVCRDLVREGYKLSKRKGTRWALARIIEIVLGTEAQILEHNTMRGYLLSDGAQLPPNLKEGGVYDVTILINKPVKETMRHQLLFLLDQFKPIRARLHLIQLNENAETDGNAYLDMNAAIPRAEMPTLDADVSMGGALTLE
ncbi:MAG: phage tail protein [Lachnospiraceae bacterium]|nr:phage tail protein [Lachnospiraceae bacterium]